jgi:hypothetical protein
MIVVYYIDISASRLLRIGYCDRKWTDALNLDSHCSLRLFERDRVSPIRGEVQTLQRSISVSAWPLLLVLHQTRTIDPFGLSRPLSSQLAVRPLDRFSVKGTTMRSGGALAHSCLCSQRVTLALLALVATWSSAGAQLNCESVDCARDCSGSCGWSQIFGLCVSGAHTSVTELGLCRGTATSAPTAATAPLRSFFTCVSTGLPPVGNALSAVAVANTSSCSVQATALGQVLNACNSDAPTVGCLTSARIPTFSFLQAGCRTSSSGVTTLNEVRPPLVPGSDGSFETLLLSSSHSVLHMSAARRSSA